MLCRVYPSPHIWHYFVPDPFIPPLAHPSDPAYRLTHTYRLMDGVEYDGNGRMDPICFILAFQLPDP